MSQRFPWEPYHLYNEAGRCSSLQDVLPKFGCQRNASSVLETLIGCDLPFGLSTWISNGVSKTLALWPLGAVFTGLSVPLPIFTFVVPRNQQKSVDILWEIVFVIAFPCYAECVYHQMRLSGSCWLYLHVCWYHMLVRQISKTTLQCCGILLIPQAQLSSHHNLLLCQIL